MTRLLRNQRDGKGKYRVYDNRKERWVEGDEPGGRNEHFVIMLKDNYARAALTAYAAAWGRVRRCRVRQGRAGAGESRRPAAPGLQGPRLMDFKRRSAPTAPPESRMTWRCVPCEASVLAHHEHCPRCGRDRPVQQQVPRHGSVPPLRTTLIDPVLLDILRPALGGPLFRRRLWW